MSINESAEMELSEDASDAHDAGGPSAELVNAVEGLFETAVYGAEGETGERENTSGLESVAPVAAQDGGGAPAMIADDVDLSLEEDVDSNGASSGASETGAADAEDGGAAPGLIADDEVSDFETPKDSEQLSEDDLASAEDGGGAPTLAEDESLTDGSEDDAESK
ncbi:hypothetical protein LPB19_14245 [Marinobacter salinisoli]|uniref:Chemotaxis protein CheA n=1 Tax=Marinobacter salinisoli TaxID=2769486 RepID=A0ABX7MPS8_9GAMM|nr:hypothetical protein [Marinobacter salinisoli]QSP94327.1 hypothetical protein LPB19_14245 [Marinobacter salinisoli]